MPRSSAWISTNARCADSSMTRSKGTPTATFPRERRSKAYRMTGSVQSAGLPRACSRSITVESGAVTVPAPLFFHNISLRILPIEREHSMMANRLASVSRVSQSEVEESSNVHNSLYLSITPIRVGHLDRRFSPNGRWTRCPLYPGTVHSEKLGPVKTPYRVQFHGKKTRGMNRLSVRQRI
jgi:hypothetical protein